MSRHATSLAVALLLLVAPLYSVAQTQPADKNYHLVFHTEVSGQDEDIGMTISEGNFSMKIGDPDIAISGILEVTEDFMYRLDYQFSHVVRTDAGEGEARDRYYERGGQVILQPGKTVDVIDAPDVKLGIELKN